MAAASSRNDAPSPPVCRQPCWCSPLQPEIADWFVAGHASNIYYKHGRVFDCRAACAVCTRHAQQEFKKVSTLSGLLVVNVADAPWLAELQLCQLNLVQELTLTRCNGTGITRRALKSILNLASLVHLELDDCQWFTSMSLGPIGACGVLKSLTLKRVPTLTDRAFKGNWPCLEYLTIATLEAKAYIDKLTLAPFREMRQLIYVTIDIYSPDQQFDTSTVAGQLAQVAVTRDSFQHAWFRAYTQEPSMWSNMRRLQTNSHPDVGSDA